MLYTRSSSFHLQKKKRGKEVLLMKQDMGAKISRTRKSKANRPGVQTLRHPGPQDVRCAGCPLGCCLCLLRYLRFLLSCVRPSQIDQKVSYPNANSTFLKKPLIFSNDSSDAHLVCWGCCNKTPQTGWLTGGRILFLTILEVEKTKIKSPANLVSGEVLPPGS